MGGLVAADTLIGMVNSRPDKQAPLWPKIVACIALDTPVSMFFQDPESSVSKLLHLKVLRTASLRVQKQCLQGL